MSVTLERPQSPLAPPLGIIPGQVSYLPESTETSSRFSWDRERFRRLSESGVLPVGIRLELMAGDLIETVPEEPLHVEGMDAIEDALARTLDLTTCFLRVQHPLPLSNTCEPVPDIAIIRGKRRDYRGRHPSPADTLLVIEVSRTTLAYDRGTKVAAYAAAGIPEYWILNLVDRQLEVFRSPADGLYAEQAVYHAGDSLSPILAPNAEVAISELLL